MTVRPQISLCRSRGQRLAVLQTAVPNREEKQVKGEARHGRDNGGGGVEECDDHSSLAGGHRRIANEPRSFYRQRENQVRQSDQSTFSVQGDTAGCTRSFVDMNLKVAFTPHFY